MFSFQKPTLYHHFDIYQRSEVPKNISPHRSFACYQKTSSYDRLLIYIFVLQMQLFGRLFILTVFTRPFLLNILILASLLDKN